MSLVAVGWPSTESEAAVMISLLDAHDVPHFVHGAGIGSILPGVQIGSYNTRTVVVPESQVQYATEILAVLELAPSELKTAAALQGFLEWFRMLVEVVMFGWFVPGSSGRSPVGDGDGVEPTPLRESA